MSFLYRPTPVVVIGGGAFSSHRTLARLPGSVMLGIPLAETPLGKSAPSGGGRSRVSTRRPPWILSGGTMGGFVPNGLGQDDGGGDIFSTPISTPIIPDSVSPLPSDVYGPLAPGEVYTPPVPDLGPSFSPGTYAPIPVATAPPAAPAAPAAGAGPTGTGIPGTQALNVAQQGISFFQKIFGVTKPVTAAPAGYTALPGYGGTAAPGTSWFSQRTIAPSLGSNGMVAAIAVVALLVLGGGGFAAGRAGR